MENSSIFEKFSVLDIDSYDKVQYNLSQMMAEGSPKVRQLINQTLINLEMIKGISDEMVKRENR